MSKLDLEVSEIERVTRVGMGFNIGLAVLKLTVGQLAGSIALIADGFNSLSDVVTDMAVIIGTRLGSRPADRDHPFGHGKLETFVAGLVSLGIMAVGVGITWSAISSFAGPADPPNGLWVILVAGFTILTKEWLYRATSKIASRCRSAALNAKAWDHRSDAFVSSVVLIGGGTALLGWTRGDSIAGLIVGLVIIVVGGRMVFDVFRELSEGSADVEIDERIQQVLKGFDEVRGWHRLRIRVLGRELSMDVHILLDPNLTIHQGHQIVRRIEQAIQDQLNWPVNTIIHVDPDSEEIRRARRAAGDSTLR